jgi:drug/metabolite transporter (DMT)-like permease
MEAQMQKQNPFGLLAVVGASTLWAIAANVASSLFAGGVSPFELAGVNAILAMIGLAAIKLLRRQPFKPPNLPQLGLSALFVLFVGANNLAIANFPLPLRSCLSSWLRASLYCGNRYYRGEFLLQKF